MNDELNLLTNEEKFEQKTSLIFRILNIVFVVLFLIIASYSVYSYLEYSKLTKIEDELKSQKAGLLTELGAFVSEDNLIRDTIHRFNVYQNFSGQIEDISEIVKEIYVRAFGTSVEILTINFNYDSKEISIRVRSSSEQFTRFVNNLKNPEFKGEGSLYPNLFYPSSKNEEVDQAIKEYIVYIKYKPEVIKK